MKACRARAFIFSIKILWRVTFIWQEFVVICRIWNFVAFIGIVSTSTDYSSLRLVQFFAENDILIGVGSYLRVDLLHIKATKANL